MPIKVPQRLPAIEFLKEENIFVMEEERATQQDIRPLEILILNLMPKKRETETQLLRLLSNTPLQLNVEFLHMSSHATKNTSSAYLERFYNSFNEIKDKRYDGLIITGAPVEQLNFENVDYWQEFVSVLNWSKTHVFSTLHICWGAQAGLYHHYKIPKFEMKHKLSGVYEHGVLYPQNVLFRGFDDCFWSPHSRHTEVRKSDILQHTELSVLAESEKAGVLIASTVDNREVYVMGHCEYDRNTLRNEYLRDAAKGLNPKLPENYFPKNDPNLYPKMVWHSSASLLFSNWLNYVVYQDTPFELDQLDQL